MKSSIRVDYASIYGNLDDDNKRPIIRVDLQKSDDPRDALLNDLMKDGKDLKLGVMANIGVQELGSNSTSSTVHILYSKPRYEQICDIAKNVFECLQVIHGKPDLELNISFGEIYFRIIQPDCKNIKSNGCRKEDLQFLSDREVYKMLVKDGLSLIEKSRVTNPSHKKVDD